MIDVSPHRDCLLREVVVCPFALRVAEECPVLTGVDLVGNEGKHVGVELKHGWHLHKNHANEVKELNEDWTSLIILEVAAMVTHAALEHVPETQPVLFDQDLESLDCAVSAVQEELSEGT